MPAGIAHPRPRIGISSCLLGERVRHDGGDKRDPVLIQALGHVVEWVPVCPEVELGLGTPREPIRLIAVPRARGAVRLETVTTRVDLTDRMRAYARQRVRALSAEHLSGYVFKKDSPSCGIARVDVWNANGTSVPAGRGLFAAELIRHCPTMPVEEEDRLRDPDCRDRFLERVLEYTRERHGEA